MIYTVNQTDLIMSVAQELKSHIDMPEWAQFVKSGAHRETLPKHSDWWFIRAASILRMTYKEGPIGVGKLRTKYGGRKNRGVRPDQFELASGKIIRTILQQLEAAELINQKQVQAHKGRIASPKGASLLVECAKRLAK